MSDYLPSELIAAAMRLVGAVHDEGRPEVDAALRGVDLRGLCVTLAAMVPDDQTASQLLAWNDGDSRWIEPRRPFECGVCGDLFECPAATGRPPSRCDRCRPTVRTVGFVPESCDGAYVGTETGYKHHRNNRTTSCRRCRAAHAEAEQRRADRRRNASDRPALTVVTA